MNYSIKQVSEKLNISAHTLRYYEKEKVIFSVQRDENGIRRYDQNDMNWLELVNCLKETGMSLTDIKKMVELSSGENPDKNIPKRLDILQKHREKVLERMDAMKKNLIKVDKKIAYYESISKNVE